MALRRDWRLRRPADFQRVRRDGRALRHPLMVLIRSRRPDPEAGSRIGISVSRRVGGAVQRNRLKRRIKEAIRPRYATLPAGWDLVFILRPAACEASYQALDSALAGLLQRAGLEPAEVACDASLSA